MVDRLTDIADDARLTNYMRSIECLKILDILPPDDMARDDYRAAAQVFALLSLAEVIAT